MLRAVLFAVALTASPAEAKEFVLETRKCIHPAVVERLKKAMEDAESTGEPVNPIGDWANCEVVKGFSGNFINEYDVKGEPLIYRLFYDENGDKLIFYIQKLIDVDLQQNGVTV